MTVEFVSMYIALAAITVSAVLALERYRSKAYADLDTLYMDVLKIGIEYPDFRNPEKTTNYKTEFKGGKLIQYNTYAYIAWNVCETVYDRTHKSGKNWDTWRPIIVAEKKLHNAWLLDPENHHKFKEKFRNFITNGLEASSGPK